MNITEDIRVIGLDLDSTLLKDDKTISDYTKSVLERAIEKGIYILPATGRVVSGIPECVKAVKGIEYAVCSNGASVLNLSTGEEIYSSKIPLTDALAFIDLAEKYDTMYDCYAEGRGYAEKRFMDKLECYGMEPVMMKLARQTRTTVSSLKECLTEMQCDVEKFNLFFADNEKRLKAMEELSKIPYLKITSSLPNNIEINARDCNKGTALIGFARKLGFTREQVMACGDGSNDYDMIVAAGIGVAMSNAKEELKQAADYITVSNEEDGVAKAIERLCIRMK